MAAVQEADVTSWYPHDEMGWLGISADTTDAELTAIGERVSAEISAGMGGDVLVTGLEVLADYREVLREEVRDELRQVAKRLAPLTGQVAELTRDRDGLIRRCKRWGDSDRLVAEHAGVTHQDVQRIARTAGVEIHNVQLGDPLYEQVIGCQLRADAELRRQMWEDAEHELEEAPGKVWTVVLAPQDGRMVLAAWCAARVEEVDGQRMVRCSDGYERRGPGRRHALYRLAYEHRERTVVQPAGLPAWAVVYVQPLAQYLAGGYVLTGAEGEGQLPGHHWWVVSRAA